MTTFQINDEIDKIVDKMTNQLKERIKKLIVRHEKLVLRRYIASVQATDRALKKKTKSQKNKSKLKSVKTTNKRQDKRSSNRIVSSHFLTESYPITRPHNERAYKYVSDSDSDSASGYSSSN